MTSFFLAGATKQIENAPTTKLHESIDWPQIESHVVGPHWRDSSRGGGSEPYATLSMFKLMLPGQLHPLSDAQLEQALRVWQDFLVFCDFDPGSPLPDLTTICRFRKRLVAAKLEAVLLVEINDQLALRGLKVNKARGAIIDASFTNSSARANRTIEVDAKG